VKQRAAEEEREAQEERDSAPKREKAQRPRHRRKEGKGTAAASDGGIDT